MNVKKFLLISALAAALLMGCTANGQEAAPDPADYDTDCRMREYGKPMTFNELDRYLDETSKRVLDEGKTWEEAADELGVPYYEKCKVTGGE
jgi:outer membrane biogenesis lipoprotein LolB